METMGNTMWSTEMITISQDDYLIVTVENCNLHLFLIAILMWNIFLPVYLGSL